MKPVIVLGIANGVVECISNPTDTDVILHDFDIQDTDNPNFEYGNDGDDDFMIVRFTGEGTPPEPQHGREPKPLAQYLGEYLDTEIERVRNEEWLERALDAYQSVENVVIQIIKKKER